MPTTSAEYMRKWRAKNTVKSRSNSRKYYFKRKYGLTSEMWNALFISQGSKCLICQTTEPTKPGWHTDHNHSTGNIRGILCSSCNMGIGLFKDNPKFLLEASKYLLKGTE